MQREWRDRERKWGRRVDGGVRGAPAGGKEEDVVMVVVWARWDSRPEENANEPRGRAESERRRMVWWFGCDCRVGSSLALGEQEDEIEAGGFGEEIAGFSSLEVIWLFSDFEAMYLGKYAGVKKQSLQGGSKSLYLRRSNSNDHIILIH